MTMPKERLEDIQNQLTRIGARMSIVFVDNMLADLSNMPKAVFGSRVDELNRRIRDELSLMQFLHISSDMAKYYRPTSPLFGTSIEAKFLSVAFELDEAAKCLALGRPTASVFHLMRIVELGVRTTARCLQIPDPTKPYERNWGNILRTIRDEGIAVKWPTPGARMSGDCALFEELYASLDAVRNPWRNATMHVERKYTDDEAEHIFVAVKGFMVKLASRCDEDGKPFA
jgi:hypothetical protein